MNNVDEIGEPKDKQTKKKTYKNDICTIVDYTYLTS